MSVRPRTVEGPGRNGRAAAPAREEPAHAYGAPPQLGVVAPRAPRRRAAVIGVVIGLLLAVVCALGFSAILGSVDKRSSVLVTTRPMVPGQRFTAADLGVAKVGADSGVETVAAADRGRIVGRVAAFGVPQGALLTSKHISSSPAIEAGSAVVGLALRAGQFPAGVRPGDRVRLVSTAGQSQSDQASQGTVLVAEAKVFAVGAETGQGGTLSVVVRDADAAKVTAAAASGSVGVALLGGAA